MHISLEEQLNLNNADFSGIMMIGIVNKRNASLNKVIGSIINYTLTGGEIKVKIFLDANKRTMTIFSTNKPEGEVFSDLPKDGIFYPAIQNKTQKFSKTARLCVQYDFDLQVPKDKSKIVLNDEVESNGDTFDSKYGKA